MNYKMILIIFFAYVSTTTIDAQEGIYDTQTYNNDSLIIERKNGQKVRLVWDFRKNLNKSIDWEQLLNDFQLDFSKVVDNIPEFDFYKIDYVQKQQLVIDEVRGRETYTVNEMDEMKYTKSNICMLKAKDLILSIEFNATNELLDSSLLADIKEATSKVKHKFYFSMITRNRHYYSIEKSEMIKNPGPKLSLIMPFGSRIGIVKNKPYVELRPGIGVKIGQREVLALNADFVFNYNSETNRTETDAYIGLNVSSIDAGLGTEIAVKVSDGISEFEDISLRFSLNYKTSSGINLGFDYYTRKRIEATSKNLLVGFHLGYGF